MKRIRERIENSRAYKSLHKSVKETYITKHDLSLHLVWKIFMAQLKKDNITERASSMAFNFTLSIFPTIIFAFTLIPYIPIPHLTEDLMAFLKENIPASIYDVTSTTIFDIIAIPHGGLLSFGFLFALFSATNGIRVMISAFNRCYKTSDKRNFFKVVFIASLLALFLSLIVFLAGFISLIIKLELNHLEQTISAINHEFYYFLLIFCRFLILFMLFYFAISLIYFMAPSMQVRWSFFSLGSLVASLLSLLFTVGFFYYINNFNSYNKVYGSIGAIIGVMMWFYFLSVVLLIGFETNASIDLAKIELQKNKASQLS
jgi:membrane protein